MPGEDPEIRLILPLKLVRGRGALIESFPLLPKACDNLPIGIVDRA